MYYKICENCRAHLDPGETCDCLELKEHERLDREKREREMIENLQVDEKGQYQLVV